MTYLAFTFCDLEWWHAVLAWLLPFILGLLLGYALWYHYKKQKEELEDEVQGLKKDIANLKTDLDACKYHKTDLDSEIALLKGQLRERDFKISTLEASLKAASNKDNVGKGAIVGAAGLAVSAISSKKSKKDDLKKIEGIGPKIEDILNEAKIRSYSDLADKKVGKLRKVLDAAGPKFKIAKPDTWPEQAALARDGKWDELEELQDYLIGGVRPIAKIVEEKVTTDDLKKIEGVGPKIEGLLNAAGISTFAQLAEAKIASLQAILDDAGPRYRIASPDTWPEQAVLARDGNWDVLAALQDRLKGGRKV